MRITPQNFKASLVGPSTLIAFMILTPLGVLSDKTPPITRATPVSSLTPESLAEQQLKQSYTNLPLIFERNQGQVDEQVRFISRGSGYNLYLTLNEAVLNLRKVKTKAKDNPGAVETDQDVGIAEVATVQMKLVGGNDHAEVIGLDRQAGKVNYFIGNDPRKWRTNVPTYARVQYKDVYRGVDLAYYGNQRQLEYDFIVQPGANPDQIRLRFEGADKRINKSGALVLTTNSSEIEHHKPIVYQIIGGSRKAIPGSYSLKVNGEVGFEIGVYDQTRTLVIDPILSYSSYLGGENSDTGYAIAVDAAGNAYVTGETASTGFPKLNAYQPSIGNRGQNGDTDAFVTKLTPSGGLSYSTYLGGNISSASIVADDDQGFDIVTDSSSNAYVTGTTSSTNFPTLDASQPSNSGGSDVFVTKLNASGGLSYSTYLGGNSIDNGHSIASDPFGNIYVTGKTISTNFPTLNAYQPNYGSNGDAFVLKLGSDVTPMEPLRPGDILALQHDLLMKIDPVTIERTDFPDGILCNTTGLTIAPNGDIFATSNPHNGCSGPAPGAHGVYRIDPNTGNQTLVTSGGLLEGSLLGIVSARSGELFVTVETASQGSIVRVNPQTGAQSLVSSDFFRPFGIAIDRNGMLLITELFDESVVRLNPDTGTKAVVSQNGLLTGMSAAGGIAVASNGDVFVASVDFEPDVQTGFVVRIDPATGVQTLVSYGQLLVVSGGGVTGMAVEANGNLLVIDKRAGFGIIRIDPISGIQTGLDIGATPVGGIAVVPSNSAPTIMAEVGVSRQQNAGASSSSVATVNDAEDAETALTVTINGSSTAIANGVSISNIAINSVGNVTADISAGSTATNAAFTLRVTDSSGLFAEATLNVDVIASADLVISMTDSPDPVIAGDSLTYTVTVTNNGPSTATGVTLTDTLPSTVSLTSINSSQGNCNGITTITCNLGSISTNANTSVSIVVTARSPGVIENTSSVTASEPDPNLSNNFATGETAINATLLSNKDSFVKSGADNTNEGSNERLRIQNAGDNRAVVAFDLAGISTAGLQSATLILNIAENSNNWGATGRFVDAHRILDDWTEGNGRNDIMSGGGPAFRGSGEGVTWNCAKDTNISNQTANCSPLWNGANYATATAPGALHTNGLLGQVAWDVTADVLAGATHGWTIKKREENQNGQVRYYSREGAAMAGDASLSPRLVLIYRTSSSGARAIRCSARRLMASKSLMSSTATSSENNSSQKSQTVEVDG